MTSVVPRHHFSHIPLQQLRAEDPQSLTSVNGGSPGHYRPTQYDICAYSNYGIGYDDKERHRYGTQEIRREDASTTSIEDNNHDVTNHEKMQMTMVTQHT
eukprot:1714111-Amphidinium_carterae.2